MKDNNAKVDYTSRHLILLRMFYELTDEDHQMTVEDITTYLGNRGESTNLKALRKDIETLQNEGFDIVRVPSRPVRYFWGSRTFEMPELKLLIDAVSSSRFITQKKSKELTKKITCLSSTHQRKDLRRNIYATNRVKTSNESIYYIVDTVNEAINKSRKIAFKYTEYTADLKKTFRNDGNEYELSPYALFWNEDYYYIVGWSDKHGNVSVFRADRLNNPRVLDEKAVKKPDDFNLDAYSKRIFEMYDGEPVKVRLSCKNELAKYIVDRFGDKLKTKLDGKDTFEVVVEVSLSPNFYAWVFRFGGDIRILSPAKAAGEYASMLKAAMTMQSL